MSERGTDHTAGLLSGAIDRLIAERDRLVAALADRDAQVTEARKVLARWGVQHVLSVQQNEMLRALRRALDGAGDEPRPEWRHCRWIEPHPAVPKPGTEIERVRATGKPGAECTTCGEALWRAAEPTGDEPPTEPRGCCQCCDGAGSDHGCGGPCTDCYGTGCAHPEPLCAGRPL